MAGQKGGAHPKYGEAERAVLQEIWLAGEQPCGKRLKAAVGLWLPARVEQKNWTHVRQLVGYGRLEQPEQAERLNALYVKEWNLFRNFFCPVMKHLRTKVEGSRKRRVYDEPKTPFERLRDSGGADAQQILPLEKQRAALESLRTQTPDRKEAARRSPSASKAVTQERRLKGGKIARAKRAFLQSPYGLLPESPFCAPALTRSGVLRS